MDPKPEQTKGQPAHKNSPKKTEGRRGRPKLQQGEKGNYESVLLPRSITRKVDMLTEKNASIDPALLYGYVDSFEEYDQVRQYYWKLIFSYSIYKVIDNLRTLQKLDDGHLGTSEIADLLKINAFNLKRLSVGKGQTTFFVKLIDSLYRYGVNIMEVKYKPGIVLITYARYIQAVGQD